MLGIGKFGNSEGCVGGMAYRGDESWELNVMNHPLENNISQCQQERPHLVVGSSQFVYCVEYTFKLLQSGVN